MPTAEGTIHNFARCLASGRSTFTFQADLVALYARDGSLRQHAFGCRWYVSPTAFLSLKARPVVRRAMGALFIMHLCFPRWGAVALRVCVAFGLLQILSGMMPFEARRRSSFALCVYHMQLPRWQSRQRQRVRLMLRLSGPSSALIWERHTAGKHMFVHDC